MYDFKLLTWHTECSYFIDYETDYTTQSISNLETYLPIYNKFITQYN